MSLENEDDSSAIEASESINESEKKPRISYTRDFLLSLSELEICKRLPNGFDQSILRDFEENSIQERPRTHGGIPLQGFRRNDYSSSPPTRGDSSNYSRGVYGRWDNRSSGWSDKDGDSQSDMDPDSGRRNHSRRPWQNSEHDGLLGSGSFPRPSGFSASKGSSNEHYHLNRSTEAYQPPRPFKAGPASRTNTHDSFNDETFGSIESTSQDRAEEERKRRASFELMRKEQQKVLQEKQKTSANKLLTKSDGFADLILEECKEEGVSEGSSELNSIVQSVPKDDDSGRSSFLSQSSKSRPLVPPGFKTTILDKSSTTKPIFSTDKENPKSGIEEIHLLPKGNHTQNGTLDNQGNLQSGSSVVSTDKLGITDQHLRRISGFPEAVDGEVFEFMTNKVGVNKIPNNSSQESTSILGKFFTKDAGSTGFLEQKSKPDDPLSPHNAQSSRFAQWFSEDDKKPVDDFSSTRPNDLLSLIGGGEKASSQAPSMTSTDPEYSHTGFGITKTPLDPEPFFNNFRQESAPPVAAVLTCEDLEQTILSEYSEKSSNLQPHVPDWSISSQDNVGARTAVDNHATNHLLSLLQKGTKIDETHNTNTENRTTSEKRKDANQEANLGQNLSLEALFGTAFMKELQSAQAPVSAQRGAPPGSARIDIFEPHELSVSNIDGIGPTMTNYETSKQKQPVKSDDPESWLNFDGQPVNAEFQRGVSKPGKQAGDIQLPEEESLIIVGDPANVHNPNVGKMLPPADVATFDISEKLAVLNSGFRGEQSVREMLEHERQFNSHSRRPMFHPSLDPNPQHMNSQMRFPEHLMQRENPLNQQFPVRLFQHHPDAAAAARVGGFDVPVHPQMLPQMRMQGNFPPHRLIHHDHLQRPQASNFMPDHGFPFAHQHTNIGGLGLPLSVPDGSGGNPEAFQRMMEMERRAQSKAVNTQGMYRGHELDMDMGLGFRYR